MFSNLKYAFRSLLKTPGLSATVVLTLALGIGATTAIFSALYATLLRPLPYPQAERMVAVRQVDAEGRQMPLFSNLNFQDIRDSSESFAALAEYSSWLTTATGGREAMRLKVAQVSKGFFAAMGVRPVLGRSFAAQEQQANGAPVVLASHAYWKSALHGTRDLSGKHVDFDGKAYSIVGVMPAGFRFPDEAELWIPDEQLEKVSIRNSHNWLVVGRLKSGITLQRAQLDVSGIARALKKQYREDTLMSDAAVIPLRDAMAGQTKTALLLLFGAAGILLLAACANTANLLLARAASRHQELAVRVAVGAGRRELLWQFFAEAGLLSLVGAALGVLLAYWTVQALLGLAQQHLPGVTDIQFSLPILTFSIGVSLLTAMGLSLMLGLRAGQEDSFKYLKQGAQRAGGGVRDVRLRAVLMVTQVAIATLLLAGTGLLIRSLLQVMDVRPGYRTDNVLTADIFLRVNDVLDFVFHKNGAEAERLRRGQLLDEIVRRVSAIPGIDSAGVARDRPLSAGSMGNGAFLLMNNGNESVSIENMQRLGKIPGGAGSAWYQAATAGYFSAMQIPLRRGRLFDVRDTAASQHVALISESVARQYWPNQDPIGRYLNFAGMDGDFRPLQIAGVVGDARYHSLEADPEPVIYVNAIQRAPTYFSLVMHTTSSPLALISSVRSVLRDVNPNLAPRFQLFPQIVSASFGERQFQLYLLGMFAIGALLLAVVGIYGVTSYMVMQRTREIGVRMALGAQAPHVLGLVLRQGVVVVAIGIGLGVCAELALASLLRSLLYGISVVDPLTLIGVGVLLAGLTVLACWIPARRATQVDPLVALRAE